MKLHDDGLGKGLVARLWNLAVGESRADLAFTPGISAAHRASHIETDLEPVSLTVTGTLPTSFKRQQIQTYRVLPK